MQLHQEELRNSGRLEAGDSSKSKKQTESQSKEEQEKDKKKKKDSCLIQ
jgi:hypothetical protein